MNNAYVVTNNYHDTIEFDYENTDLGTVVKDVMEYLKDHSKDFDNEVEEDWEQYYDTYEQAQDVLADNILETFIDETSIWLVPNNTNISELTTGDLIFNRDKYTEFKLKDVKDMYEVTNNKKELEEELSQAIKKYGNDILILNSIEVVTIKELAKDDDFEDLDENSEEDMGVTHVYRIDWTWWGYLTGLVLNWYTDEDFSSGVFEEETIEALYLLKNLNKFMKEFDSTEWDFEASNKRIDELEKSLD